MDLLETNKLIVNGRSTADLSFYCAVESLDPPQRAERKDRLYVTDTSNGYAKQTIDAYKAKEKRYQFYLYDINEMDIREFKVFISDSGWFIPYDESLKYHFEKTTMSFEEKDEFGGYECEVIFYCQPFGMEDESSVIIGNDAMTIIGAEWNTESNPTMERVYFLESATQIINHTNAPMYPLVEVRGAIGVPTFLQIGEQRMTFKEIQDVIYIESKPHYQDVYGSGGKKLNNIVRGDFFEIQPGTNKILKGEGISLIKITERWGWR